MESTAGKGVIGRPRETRTDRSILTATIKLIAERGIQDVRTEDVAQRAGVGKGAIYRRYRSKDDLITAAVAELVSDIAIPDTGSTRADVLGLMRGAVAVYTDPTAAGVMPSIVGEMARRPELARVVRAAFLSGRRSALREVLERGIARGDLGGDMDLELALDVLGGPLFYRLLITGGPIDERLAENVTELILRGFAPGEARRTKSPARKKETSR